MSHTQKLDTHALVEIAKRHQLAHLALFGSYARGQATGTSDVDLYARFGRPVTLFEVLAVKYEIEDALGRSVDLIVEEAVIAYPFVYEGMARDRIVLYDADRQAYAVAK